MSYGFEEILGRLKAGLQGQVSALEGTFTGDILQAVAAELARIWSQEMDTVTQRGFVETAEGGWLDALCGNYGVKRKEGESDEKLRQRVLDHIRARGASGNAADYVAWALALDGVVAASAVPLGHGAGAGSMAGKRGIVNDGHPDPHAGAGVLCRAGHAADGQTADRPAAAV